MQDPRASLEFPENTGVLTLNTHRYPALYNKNFANVVDFAANGRYGLRSVRSLAATNPGVLPGESNKLAGDLKPAHWERSQETVQNADPF